MTEVDTPRALRVEDNPERKRFEGFAENDLAGFVDYIPLPGKIIATHTQVGEEYEGKGVGKRLVTGMLDLLRADGRQIQPLCPYVAAFLDKHPQYDDLVDPTTPR